MRFRPALVPTLWFAVFFLTLVGLGVWQLERLQWKLALIASVNANMAAPPLTLDQALAADPAAIQYRRVTLRGVFDHAREAYAFGTEDGAPVYHVLTPFKTARGTLLVDRGEVPQDKRAPATRAAGQVRGPRTLVGVWRTPDKPGLFAPPPDRTRRVFYTRDVAAIAALDGVHLAAPVLIEAGPAPNPGGLPKGGKTVVTFRNEHLQYAITWFLLAVGLLAVYLAYHVRQGRLARR